MVLQKGQVSSQALQPSDEISEKINKEYIRSKLFVYLIFWVWNLTKDIYTFDEQYNLNTSRLPVKTLQNFLVYLGNNCYVRQLKTKPTSHLGRLLFKMFAWLIDCWLSINNRPTKPSTGSSLGMFSFYYSFILLFNIFKIKHF